MYQHWTQTLVALSAHLQRSLPVAPTAIPGVVVTLVAAAEQALADAGVASQISAIESTPRTVALMLQTSDLSPTQTRQVRARLRVVAPTLRWSGSPRLVVPLPLAASPASASASLCVPILRCRHLGRAQTAPIVWWPLRESHPLLLVGDALPTLAVILQALKGAPGLLLFDPEQALAAAADAPWPAHTPDALTLACTQTLRCAYQRARQPDAPPLVPLTLVVVAPDAATWRDLAPLFMRPGNGVRLILALTLGVSHPMAQDACRCGHVVEVGALGRSDLPEACRPPGLAAPSSGEVLAWQTPQRVWRGAPVRR